LGKWGQRPYFEGAKIGALSPFSLYSSGLARLACVAFYAAVEPGQPLDFFASP